MNTINNYLSLLSKYRGALMGFAILWVMFFHFMKPNVPVLIRFLALGYGGVDIFLFLSGFGLYFSMSKPNFKLSIYYKSRFSRIFPEYWLFLIVTFLMSMRFDIESLGILLCKASTLGYWFQAPYSLWYVSCIVVFYALFPFYYKLFKKWGFKIPIIFIIIGLLMIAIYGFIMVYVYDNENVGNFLILSISRIPIFIIGSVFGYIAKNGIIPLPIRSMSSLSLISSAFILLVMALGLLCYFKIYYSEYGWTCSLLFLPFIIITPTLCILLVQCFEKMPRWIIEGLTWIGALSFELFIVHLYIYRYAFSVLEGRLSESLIFILALLIIFVAAILFKWTNDRLLQKIFNR